jgi:hypothetical protein
MTQYSTMNINVPTEMKHRLEVIAWERTLDQRIRVPVSELVRQALVSIYGDPEDGDQPGGQVPGKRAG